MVVPNPYEPPARPPVAKSQTRYGSKFFFYLTTFLGVTGVLASLVMIAALPVIPLIFLPILLIVSSSILILSGYSLRRDKLN